MLNPAEFLQDDVRLVIDASVREDNVSFCLEGYHSDLAIVLAGLMKGYPEFDRVLTLARTIKDMV